MAIKFSDVEKRPSYLYARIDRTVVQYKEMDMALRWCKEHECGKVVNRNSIAFKSEEEMTMFLIRWS
jgi:hypothetical protein